MSLQLWLYSAKCIKLQDNDNLHHILLFCLDQQRKTHVIRVTEYSTFLTILPCRQDAEHFDQNFETLAKDIHERNLTVQRNRRQKAGFTLNENRVEPLVTHVEAYKARKLMGYQYLDSSCCWVLKLWLRRESDRHKVSKLLRDSIDDDNETKMRIGTMKIDQFVHEHILPETEFMHDRGLEYYSWFRVSNYRIDNDSRGFFDPNVVVVSCSANNIRAFRAEEIEPEKPPSLRKLYIRVEAHSSTATKQSQHNPNWQFAKDAICCIAISTSDVPELSEPRIFLLNTINDKHTKHLKQEPLITVHDSEEELLREFGKCVVNLQIHAIVFASDEKSGPTSLFYLMKRAKLYPGVNLGLSKLPCLTSRCDMRPCGKSNNEYLVQDNYGMERIDICKILPTAMVSPNLDGFTLLDAVRHDNLVPRDVRPFFQSLCNLDYVGTNTFSSPEEVVADIKINLQLLRVIEQRCNFVMQQQDISNMCCIDVTSVVERGQQLRGQNIFYKWCHKKRAVINSDQTKQPYLVVAKPRQESSYPRPPWLTNPPVDVMRSEKRPGHVIRETIPNHVRYLLQEEHSNTILEPCSGETKQGDSTTQQSHALASDIDAIRTRDVCDGFAEELQKLSMSKLEQRVDESIEENENESKQISQNWWSNKRKCDFAVKSRKRIKTQAEKDNEIAFRGGSVLEPSPGYYSFPWEAVLTVDFTSLYPSVMRAYNICYMRVIYDAKYLSDPNVEVEYVPITETHCVVFAKRYRDKSGMWHDVETITPEIVKNVMELRDRVKKLMKAHKKGTFEYNVLDSRQLAAKTIANSLYGFFGSQTSNTPCTAIAAAITQIGQFKIHTVRFTFLFFGHAALYGDTDSNMIRFWVPAHLKTKDEILTYIVNEGLRIVEIYSRICIAPNRLEPETIKYPFLLLPKKKTYAAIQYEPVKVGIWNNPECAKETIKGMAAKKRDKCEFAQDIGCTLVSTLLQNPSVTFEELAKWFEQKISKIPMGKIHSIQELNPFIITCSLNAEYKQDPKTVRALHLADMTERCRGARPRVGTRIPYVMAYKPKEKLQSQCCEIPSIFLKSGSLLDVKYILVNQVLNVTKQILSLTMHQALFAMFEKSVQRIVCEWSNKRNNIREISHFFHKKTLEPTC